MGLLDELKEKAEQLKAEEQAQQDAREAMEATYQSVLRPVMLEAYQFFKDLTENLNVVKPNTCAVYPLDPAQPAGTLLQQSGYRLEYNDPKQPRQIDILCQCTLPAPLEFELIGRHAVERHTALLDGYKFFYHRKDKRNHKHEVVSASFILEGPMRPHIRVLADPHENCVHVLLRNIEDEPLRRYRFNPEQFDQQLLERLARVMLREERALVQVAVSESVRQQLQARLQQDALLKTQRLEQAQAEAVAAEERIKGSIADRARRVVTASRDRLRKFKGSSD